MPVQLHAACNVTTSYTGRVPQQFSFALWTHDEKLQTQTSKDGSFYFFFPHTFFLLLEPTFPRKQRGDSGVIC